MAKDVYIVATPPTGVITQIGSDYARGVWVEDASWEHSLVDKGALRAQFTLQRRPDVEWPDLQAFTPIVIYKAGSVAWSGRVQETPTIRGRENQITVQCEGWPAHLKDDALQSLFVHNDLAAWKDVRAMGATSGSWQNVWNVDAGAGNILMSAPQGAVLNQQAGVTLDAGPFSTIASITITYVGGGSANLDLWSASETGPAFKTETIVIDATPIAAVTTTVTITFALARRYVTIFALATGATAAGTSWVSITNLIAYGSTSYQSGNVSVLKASNVLTSVLPYAPKVSQSTTKITATTFSIPHFVGPMTSPNDYIDAANAYHLYQSFLLDDSAGGSPQLVFQPVPSSPTIVANVGDDIVFEDASRNDGGDIYNRVVVDYTDAAGNPALEERTTSALSTTIADPDIVIDSPFGVQFTNGDFETAGGPPATGWTDTAGGQITRDVVVFDTGVASGVVQSAAVTGNWSTRNPTTTSGFPFAYPGRRFRLQYRIRRLAGWTTEQNTVTITAVTSAGTLAGSFTDAYIGTTLTVGAWTTKTLDFTWPWFGSYIILSFSNGSGGAISTNMFNIDGVQILVARPTIVDRQNFTRTRVLSTGSRLTTAAADQIGDIFLQAHRFTPLRGTLTAQGAALRVMQGDVPIPGHLVYRKLGEAILINETDPDLGSIGRVGTIANVAYDESSDTVQIAVDSRKDYLDALFSRLSVFTGNG